ncbi:hypothetical protein PFBG_02867 [Plasmodium falciparum 7G8]|uniref:Uncharacterized protein n=1 Tax=Plasmodium falciparum (isolate 7G8) TaxID=57266 RepID=W7F767_PLAF8|nr:hypothetical protein PFBG_02867 [Plasmodium falciparum 7G8]
MHTCVTKHVLNKYNFLHIIVTFNNIIYDSLQVLKLKNQIHIYVSDKQNINMKSNCNVENYYYMENTNKLKNKMNSYRNLICKI